MVLGLGFSLVVLGVWVLYVSGFSWVVDYRLGFAAIIDCIN